MMVSESVMLLPNTKINISKHARMRIIERHIKIDDVFDALNNPVQLVYDTWNDVYIAVSSRSYAVVYAFRGSCIEVLTVLGKREYNALISKFGSKRYKIIA